MKGSLISRIVAEEEYSSKVERLFLETSDMVSDQLMRIEMPKLVKRGSEFSVCAWVYIDKLREHYYFQESMRVALRFCYVLRRKDQERMVELADKFDLTPFMFDEDSDTLEYRVSTMIKEENPLTVNIKDEFSCHYFAYLQVALDHRQLFKKRSFHLDRDLEVLKGYSGSLAALEFSCHKFCCIGEDSLKVWV